MTTSPRTTPAVLDRIARELPDHDAVVTPAQTLTFAVLRSHVRQAAAAMIDLVRPAQFRMIRSLCRASPGRCPARSNPGSDTAPFR